MAKLHILTSSAPRTITGQITADCGAKVDHAQVAFVWDETAVGEHMTYPARTCKKCAMAGEIGKVAHAYIYGICSTEPTD